jgi:hypothetical protein
LGPHPGVAVEATGVAHSHPGQHVDYELLQLVDVSGRGRGPARDGKHGVADELAGAVVSDVAAAVDREQLRSDAGRVHQHVLRLGPDPGCVDRGVFEQQQPVVSRGPRRPQRSLQRMGVAVSDVGAEPTQA